MGVAGLEDYHFSIPEQRDAIVRMAGAVDISRSGIDLKALQPKGGFSYAPRSASSTMSDGMSKKRKASVFDLQSAPVQSGSKVMEGDAMHVAVTGILALMTLEARSHMIDGYDDLPVEVRDTLLRASVSKMGSVSSIRQCTRALENLKSLMSGCAAGLHGTIALSSKQQL